MKPTLIITILLVSTVCYSQDIPKGTHKIKIYTGLSQEVNYLLIGRMLLENDYRIDRANRDFFSITSAPKPHERLNMSYLLNFVAEDSLITVSGEFVLHVSLNLGYASSEESASQIINIGMRGSPNRESFTMMLQFALKFSDNLQYVTE